MAIKDNLVGVEISFEEKTKDLDNIMKKLNIINASIKGLKTTNMFGDINKVNIKINSTTKEITKLANKTKQAKTSSDKMFDTAKLVGFGYAVKRVASTITTFTKYSADYVENMNLMQVAFKENRYSAESFINSLSDIVGLDESGLTRQLGFYKQIGNSLDIATDKADMLSKNLLKLQLDLASLYNLSFQKSGEVIQSSLAGQTKPIRGATGADITQMSLQVDLTNLGIDKQVKNLSRAEKVLLIYLSLTRQVSEAQGDMSATINTLANQQKIFSEQTQRLGRAFGNVLYPLLEKTLPLLNGILMVITELVTMFAIFVGFKIPEFDEDRYGSGLDGLDENILDITDDLDKMDKKMSGLRGFDKLNVITTPKESTSGGGGGIGSGIVDSKILDALKEYDLQLSKINSKATQIRDNIFEWLGFSKKANGEWEFSKITLGTILGTVGAIILVAAPLLKVFGILKSIGAFKGISSLIGWLGSLVFSFKAVSGGAATFGEAIKYLFPNITKALPLLGKLSIGLAGITATIMGSIGTYSSMKKMTKESEYGGKQYAKYTASVLATVGGATLLGATLGGPLGAAIGALTGVVIAGISAWIGYNDAIKQSAYENLFGNLSLSIGTINDIIKNSTPEIFNISKAFDEFNSKISNLNNNFTENANQLENYTYRFGLAGQKISEEEAPKILNAITEMTNSSSQILKEGNDLSFIIWTETFRGMTEIVKEEQNNILNNIIENGIFQQTELENAQKSITSVYENAIKTRGYLTEEEKKFIFEQMSKIRELTQTEITKTQVEVEILKRQLNDKNGKLDEESYKKLSDALKKSKEEQLEIIKQNQIDTYMLIDKEYKTTIERLKKQGFSEADAIKRANEEKEKQYNIADKKRIEDDKKLTDSIKKTSDEITKNLQDKYKKLLEDTGTTLNKIQREEKRLLENIFKDFNIPLDSLKTSFQNAGKICSQGFANGFNNGNIKFNTPQFQSAFGNEPFKLTYRSSGGLPPVGEMFIANERGPELVASAGNQTIVANENQLLKSVAMLIDSRMSSNNNSNGSNQSLIFNLGGREIAKYTLKELEEMARSNGSPITIGY